MYCTLSRRELASRLRPAAPHPARERPPAYRQEQGCLCHRARAGETAPHPHPSSTRKRVPGGRRGAFFSPRRRASLLVARAFRLGRASIAVSHRCSAESLATAPCPPRLCGGPARPVARPHPAASGASRTAAPAAHPLQEETPAAARWFPAPDGCLTPLAVLLPEPAPSGSSRAVGPPLSPRWAAAARRGSAATAPPPAAWAAAAAGRRCQAARAAPPATAAAT